MGRSINALTLVLLVAACLFGCSEDDHPQSPEPTYTGLDEDSPGVAIHGGSYYDLNGDNRAFNQLLWDGTLRVDHFGEMPPRVHEAQVTDAELAAVFALIQAERLQDIMHDGVEPNCGEPIGGSAQYFRYHDGDFTFSHQILGCDEDVFSDVNRALHQLQEKYVPFD